jgi:hypothetical protein
MMGARMKAVLGLFALSVFLATPANAEECRRVTSATVIAVVAHGGVWTRAVERGKTFTVRDCRTRMFGKVYCRLSSAGKPPVFLQHVDGRGREHTVVWGKNCR